MTKELSKFQRFKQGLRELTPAQQLHAKVVSTGGGTIGLGLAFLTFLYRIIYVKFDMAYLGFAIFLFFLIIIQYVSYVSLKQQHKAILEMSEEAEKIKELVGD